MDTEQGTAEKMTNSKRPITKQNKKEPKSPMTRTGVGANNQDGARSLIGAGNIYSVSAYTANDASQCTRLKSCPSIMGRAASR
jgi:hypothetical protein